jgi:hypothetical protein
MYQKVLKDAPKKKEKKDAFKISSFLYTCEGPSKFSALYEADIAYPSHNGSLKSRRIYSQTLFLYEYFSTKKK